VDTTFGRPRKRAGVDTYFIFYLLLNAQKNIITIAGRRTRRRPTVIAVVVGFLLLLLLLFSLGSRRNACAFFMRRRGRLRGRLYAEIRRHDTVHTNEYTRRTDANKTHEPIDRVPAAANDSFCARRRSRYFR